MCSRDDRTWRKGLFRVFAKRESRQAWEQFLTYLVRRGLNPKTAQLLISDGCPNMIKAIKTVINIVYLIRCLI